MSALVEIDNVETAEILSISPPFLISAVDLNRC
jgi:hypothetical protein